MADAIEAVDARDDHALDRLRDLDRHVVVEPPAAVLAHERTGVGQRAHELLQEERVALGLLEDRRLSSAGSVPHR